MSIKYKGKTVSGGSALPLGGTTDQVLAKASDDDGDVKWADVESGGVPSGCILIWSGASNAVPNGWALCDGTNGTPDLRGRFVLGESDSHEIGETGGSEEVALTVEQMPSHNHNISVYNSVTTNLKLDSTGASKLVSGTNTSSRSTTTVGVSKPHPNMPPYYVLCYIMKL